MTLYAIVHRLDSGDAFCTYSGMTQDAIVKMWAPVVVEFIDIKTWKLKSDAQVQPQGKI